MLIYHAKSDTYHCIYRILSILSILKLDSVEILKLRIIDFYVLFPNLISDIQLPRVSGANHLRKLVGSLKPEYEKLPPSSRLFAGLSFNQSQALKLLHAKGVVVVEGDTISKSKMFYSAPIESLLADSAIVKKDMLRLAIQILGDIELVGNNGLKVKSKLVEARYDVF